MLQTDLIVSWVSMTQNPFFCAKVVVAGFLICINLLKINSLRNHFQQYRPFILFLVKFFGVYGGLTVVYRWYLSDYNRMLTFEVDGFTAFVGKQVQQLLQILGYRCEVHMHEYQASLKVILNGQYVSRVVEGCNALSIMILFTAFVIAFSGKWQRTLIFTTIGIVLIHLMNVMRIALLSVALLYYPGQESILHGVVFPMIIYGFVFGLWVLWVNYFSNYATKS